VTGVKLLTAQQVVDHLERHYGRKALPRTWRSYVYRGTAPPPDAYATVRGLLLDWQSQDLGPRPTPLWRIDTVDRWASTRENTERTP